MFGTNLCLIQVQEDFSRKRLLISNPTPLTFPEGDVLLIKPILNLLMSCLPKIKTGVTLVGQIHKKTEIEESNLITILLYYERPKFNRVTYNTNDPQYFSYH